MCGATVNYIIFSNGDNFSLAKFHYFKPLFSVCRLMMIPGPPIQKFSSYSNERSPNSSLLPRPACPIKYKRNVFTLHFENYDKLVFILPMNCGFVESTRLRNFSSLSGLIKTSSSARRNHSNLSMKCSYI